MTNPSLREYLESLVKKGQTADAVAVVQAMLQQLPVGAEREQISHQVASNPIDWSRISDQLEKFLAAQHLVLVIGNDNISIQNVFGSTIQIIKLVVPRPFPHHLNPIPRINVATECIGREKELAELHQKLQDSNKVALVRGLGGIGKTTLVQAYVALHQDQYQHLVWITQGEDLRSTMTLDVSLAKSLEMPFQQGEDINSRFVYLMQALRAISGPNLLVIDNATAQLSEPELFQYLPSPPQWMVLVTSREDLPHFEQLELNVLRPEAALELFRMYYKGGDDAQVQELLQEIGYHTLMIELMAKTLERQRGLLRIPELLANFRNRKLDDPDLEEKLSARHSGTAEKGLFQYLMRLYNLTALGKQEVWVMQQLAVLPAVPIQAVLLAKWLKQNPRDLNRILNGMVDKGWLSRVEEGFVVHRLVQELIKYKQAPEVEELEELVEAMTKQMSCGDYGNPVSDSFPWVDYANKVANYFEAWEVLPEKLSSLLNNLALVYKYSGIYTRAVLLLKHSLGADLNRYGPNHPSVTNIQSNLAMVYEDLGEFKEATKLLKQALKINLKIFGNMHPRVATTKSCLATVYRDLGKYNRASTLLEQALKINFKNYGAKHPNFTQNQSNLAIVYADLGKNKLAAQLLEQALKADLENFGANHLSVITNQSNLATVYQDLGKYKIAAQLMEQALNSTLESFGPTHPNIAALQSNLAMIYRDLGEFKSAGYLLEKALDADLENFGHEHPNTIRCQFNLALVYYDLGDRELSIKLLEQALKADVSIFGAKHPEVAKKQYSLAIIYANNHRFKEAEGFLAQALNTIKILLGREHNLYLIYTKALEAIRELDKIPKPEHWE